MKILETIKKYLPFILIGVVVLALLCLFLPAGAIKYDADTVKATKTIGWGLIFGNKKDGYQIFEFSGGGFAALLFFVIFGVAAVALTFFQKIEKLGKYALLASGFTLCLAAFCFLTIKNMGTVNYSDWTAPFVGYYRPRIACYLGGFITFFAGIGTIALSVILDKSFGFGKEKEAPIEA